MVGVLCFLARFFNGFLKQIRLSLRLASLDLIIGPEHGAIPMPNDLIFIDTSTKPLTRCLCPS